jgi:hypothetical protein
MAKWTVSSITGPTVFFIPPQLVTISTDEATRSQEGSKNDNSFFEKI